MKTIILPTFSLVFALSGCLQAPPKLVDTADREVTAISGQVQASLTKVTGHVATVASQTTVLATSAQSVINRFDTGLATLGVLVSAVLGHLGMKRFLPKKPDEHGK